MSAFAEAYLTDLHARFAALREMAERAAAQVDDGTFTAALGDEDNSIAVLMLHVGGNLRSRFTDFLATDGEKPDRMRDQEFELDGRSRAAVEHSWAEGWAVLESTLAALRADDLLCTVHIRGEPMPVVAALSRALSHVAQHVGQLVLLAKHGAGAQWRTLSIPRAPRSAARKLPGTNGV